MIGLSPLPRGHRRRFQPTCVRPSTGSYPCLSLPWGRSPGFASALRDCLALFRLAFAAARCPLTSPRSATRWLILQKARRHSARLLRLLGGARFQALFHSPPGVLFTFPSRYWSTRYRSQESVQPWRVVPPASRGVPRAPRYSGTVPRPRGLRVRGSHPLRPAFPCRSAATSVSHLAAGSPPPWTALQPRAPRGGPGLGWPGSARRYSRDLG